MTADPVKVREWQQRGAVNYQRRQREKPRSVAPRRPPRRNDAPWREQCLERRGAYCRACVAGVPALPWSMTDYGPLEVDHIKPRGQGGPSVVENGLVLCSVHHQMKTESRMLIRLSWLEPDQVEWLAEVGWVAWDDAGQPYGRGWRHFGPIAA